MVDKVCHKTSATRVGVKGLLDKNRPRYRRVNLKVPLTVLVTGNEKAQAGLRGRGVDLDDR